MNTHHTHGDNDKILDQDLEHLGQAYGALEQDTPPGLLDQAILNRAHRAVGKKPGWLQFGWLHGLTTAAVIVLAFSIVLNQREPIPVEESLILESSPALLRSEATGKGQAEPAKDAGEIEFKALRTASEEDVSQKSATSRKEALPAGSTLSVSSAPQPAEVELREEAAPGATSTAHDTVDFLSVVAPAAIQYDEQDAAENEQLDAEQRLAEIISLKQAGDETWKAALDAFREQFPDYPLPAELED
jgi:hypothetical protein